jgi:hypothetical protein
VAETPDFENEPSRVRALLAECRERLSLQQNITVSAADAAVRHLLAIGFHLNAMESQTNDPELRAQIESAIAEADAAISELRHMIRDLEAGPEPGS